MASDRLVISLLGPPEIKVGEKLLHIKRRMFRYFIFFLACQAEPVTRESLCEMFWPEEDEAHSRKKLREVISKIRRDLLIDHLILTEKEYVSLNKEVIDVDVLRFEEAMLLLQKNQSLTTTVTLQDQAFAAVQNAVSLWRKDRFLGGVSTSGSKPFQTWVLDTAESLQYWRQAMIEWLADRCIVGGNYREALNWLNLARKTDRVNTEINLLLLTCLRDMEMWSEALRFCDILESDYKNEDQKDLPASLRDLVKNVRKDSENINIRLADQELNSLEKRPIFIGRGNLLAELNNHVNRGGILVVDGESGSGKTALLKQFHANLEILPFFLFYSANPGDEGIPYRGVVEGVRAIITNENWKALDPVYASVLLKLFPELREIRQDIAFPKDSIKVIDEHLILESFHALLEIANTKKKGLLIVDNVQWLDKESLQVVQYLVQHIKPGKIATIILSISNDLPKPRIFQLIGKELQSRPFRTVHIPPFSEFEVSEMATRQLQINCTERTARQLMRLSGGNPRYLHEILDSINENNIVVAEDHPLDAARLLNESLETLIENSLRDLAPDGVKLMQELAIFSDHFSPAVIEALTGRYGENLVGVLEELCQRRFLEVIELNNGRNEYRFAHEIVAVYFRKMINPALKRQLHLNAAKTIIRCEGDGEEQAARLAYHFDQAGEYQKVLESRIIAGIYEKKRSNTEASYEMFRAAEDLVWQLGSMADAEKIYQLVNEWGDLALQLDDMNTFTNICSTCLKLGEKRGDQKLIGLSKSGFGWVARTRGHFDIAIDFLNQAIGIFREIGDSFSLMDTYFRMGTIYIATQNFREVIRYYEKVLQIALALQSTDGMAYYKKTSAFLTYAYCIAGNLEKAESVAQQGAIISQSQNDFNYTIQVKAASAIIHYYTGELEESRSRIDEVMPQIRALNLDWWALALLTTEGQALLEKGDLTACWRMGEEISRLKSIMLPGDLGKNFENYLKGEILLQLGDLDSAEDYYLKNLEKPLDQFMEWTTKLGLVKVDLARGKIQDCKLTLESIEFVARERGFELIVQGARLGLISLALMTGNGRAIRREFAKYRDEMGKSELTGIRIAFAVLEGQYLLMMDDRNKAEAILQTALDEANEHEYFWLKLAILDNLAKAQPDHAVHLKAAQKMLEHAEFECDQEDLLQPLRKLKFYWMTKN